MKKSIFFTILIAFIFQGCISTVSQCNLKKSPNGKFFKEFSTGYAGYSWEFEKKNGKTHWMNSINFVVDGEIPEYLKDTNYDNFKSLREYLCDSRYIVIWISRNWQEWHYDPIVIQKAIDSGRIPVFMYWFFGDGLASNDPLSYMRGRLIDYQKMNQRVIKFLNKLKGEALIIFEPEFNKQKIENDEIAQNYFVNIVSKTITNFKNQTKNNLKLYTALSMSDNGSKYEFENFKGCGYTHCALGDLHRWKKSFRVFEKLKDKLDFVSFNLMLAKFSKGIKNPSIPISYSDEKLGIKYLPTRINNLTKELHTRFKKPVFLSHFVLATATWSDKNRNNQIENSEVDKEGWIREIYGVYSKLNYKQLHKNGLFGLSTMDLFDDPKHDLGGYNFFLQNEHHLGLIKTKTDSESQKPKSADIEFKEYNGKKLIELIYRGKNR